MRHYHSRYASGMIEGVVQALDGTEKWKGTAGSLEAQQMMVDDEHEDIGQSTCSPAG